MFFVAYIGIFFETILHGLRIWFCFFLNVFVQMLKIIEQVGYFKTCMFILS